MIDPNELSIPEINFTDPKPKFTADDLDLNAFNPSVIQKGGSTPTTHERSIGLDTSNLDANKPFHYDLNEHRAANQSTTDKWISGGIKGLSTFGTATGQTVAAVGGGIAATAMAALGNDFDSDTVFKNPVLTWFKELDELVKERNPNYASQAETNASVLSNMTTANFWSDDFLNGVGFLASALVTGAGAGALGVKAGLSSLGKFGTSLNTFQAAVVGRVGESAIEANDTYEQVVTQLEERRRRGEINMTDEEIEERAKRARAETFGFNMALAVPDAYQLGKIFKTVKGKSAGKSLFGKGRIATAAEQTLIESQEENFQLSVSNMAIKMANNLSDPQTEVGSKDYIANLIGGMVDNFGTKEGQKSMVLGGLLGGGMGALMKTGDDGPTKTDVPEEILKRNKHILAGLNNDIDLDTLEALAVEKNDLITGRLVKEGRLINMIYGKMTTGKMQDFEAELEGLVKKTPEQFAEIGIEVTQQEIAEQHAQIKSKAKTYASLYNKISPTLHEAIRGNLFYVHAVRNSIAGELSLLAPQVAAITLAQALAESTGVEFSMEDPLTYGEDTIIPGEVMKSQEDLKENYKALTNYSNKVKNNKTVQAEIIKNWEKKFPAVEPNDPKPEDLVAIGEMQLNGEPNVFRPYSKKVENNDGSTTFTLIEKDGSENIVTYNPGEFFDNLGKAPENRSKEGKQIFNNNERFNFLQTFSTLANKEEGEAGKKIDIDRRRLQEVLKLPDWKDRVRVNVNKRDITPATAEGRYIGRNEYSDKVNLVPSTVMHMNIEILEEGAEEWTTVNHGVVDPFRFTDNNLKPYIFANMTEAEFYEIFEFENRKGTKTELFEDHAKQQQKAIEFWTAISDWYDNNVTDNSDIAIPAEFLDIQTSKLRWDHTNVGEWTTPAEHNYLKNDNGDYVIVDTNENTSIVDGEFVEPPAHVLDELEGTRYLALVNHPSLGPLWVKAAPANMKAAEKKAFITLMNDAITNPTEANIKALNDMVYVAYKGNWNFKFDINKKDNSLRLDVYNKDAGIHHRNVIFNKAVDLTSVQDITNLIEEKTGIELGEFAYKRNLPKGQITNEQVEKIFTLNVKPDIVTGVNLKYNFLPGNIEVKPKKATDFESTEGDPDIDPEAGIVGDVAPQDDAPFKKSPTKAEEIMNYKAAVAWLKDKLPANISVADMDKVTTNIREQQYTWGMFSDNVIYLSKFAGEGTQFHEAFHAVFRTLLTDKEIAKLYNEAEKRWGIRAEIEYEEAMADEFMKWKADRTLKVGNLARALYKKIADFISMITNNQTELDALFARIDSGAFQNKELVKKDYYKFNSPVYKVLFGAKYFKMSAVRSEEVIKTAAADAIQYITDLTTDKEEKLHPLVEYRVRQFMAKRAASYNLNNDVNQALVNSFENVVAEKNKMKSLEGIYSHEPNIKLVVEEVFKLLNSYSISSVVQEQDDLEADEKGEREWDVHQGEHGGWATVSKEIKTFIGLTTYEGTDEFNRQITRAIDFTLVFTALQRRLAGMDRAQQLREFKNFARTDAQVKAVYDKFIDQTGLNTETGIPTNKMLYNRFLNTFELEPMNYVQSLRTLDPATNRKTIMSLSANRETPEKLHVENWKRKASEENRLGDPTERKGTVRGIRSAISAFRMKGDPTEEQMIEQSNKVISAVREFGMDLSLGYVFESLEGVYKNKQSRNRMLEADDLVLLANLIENGDDIYEKKLDEDGEVIDTTGAVSTLEGIAAGDINYRSDIYDSNFQDFQNKSRYAFVLPSYVLTKLREYKNGGRAKLEELQQDPYFKYNPLLQDEDALDTLLNLDPAFTGDYRDDIQEEDGVTFKTTNPKTLLLTWYGLYNENNKYSYYTPMIYEAKSTSISVKMKNKKGWVDKKGKVTPETSNFIIDTLFTQEHERLNGRLEVNSHPENVSKWVNLPFLNGASKEGNSHKGILYSNWSIQDIQSNKDGVRTALAKRITQALQAEITTHQDELAKFDIIRKKGDKITDNLLGVKSENLAVYTGNYYINDFINSISVSQLIQGDLSIMEDSFTRVKRNGGELAYGTHFGEGTSRVVYKEGFIEDRPNFKEVDTDDAQVWNSVARRKFQLDRLGRLTPELEEILDMIDRGEPLTDDQLRTEGLDLLPLKTVYYDGIEGVYHKMSETVLTKALTSDLVDGVWVAKPGKEKLHNMREFLDKEHVDADGKTYRVDSVITTSASKILTKARPLPDSAFSGTEEITDFESYDTQNKYLRLQVETHSGKEKITSGTQMAQLITLFSQDEKTIERYHQILGENREFDFDMAVTVAGTPELLAKKLVDTLESTGGDAQVIEILRTTNGEFNYNFNLPHVVKKLEQIFISHFSKGVLQQKVPGYKLTLMSSNGYNKVNGEPLRMHYEDKNGKIQLAEVAMSRRALAKILGPQASVQDIAEINKSLLRMVGTRIPTQAHHSMIPFKVVEFLPEYYGDTIIAPAEITALSGADYDIDSMFVYRKDFYTKKDKETGKKIVVEYGSAKDISESYEEYNRYHLDNNKDLSRTIRNRRAAEPDAKFADIRAEVFTEFGLAPTLVDFTQLEPKEQKTNGARNNELVDIYLKILTDASIPDLFDPVTLKPLKDAAKLYYNDLRDLANKERDNPKMHYGINGKLAAHTAAATGKRNVGPIAFANNISAFFTNEGIKLSEGVEFLGQEYYDYGVTQEDDIDIDFIEGKWVVLPKPINSLKTDSLSTLVSGMTDDAKHGFSAKLNLEFDNLGVFANMISLGMGFNRTMLFANQDILFELSSRIKTNPDKSPKAMFKSLREEVSRKVRAQNKEFTDADIPQLGETELLNAIKEGSTPEMDLAILAKFEELSKLSAQFMEVGTIISLNKGVGVTSLLELDQKLDRINKVYNNPSTKPVMSNLIPALERNYNTNRNIWIARNIKLEMNNWFLASKNVYTRLHNKLRSQLPEYLSPQDQELIDRSIKSYLTFQGLKQVSKNPDFSSFNALLDPNETSETIKKTLLQEIEDLSSQEDKQAARDFNNNEFIKILKLDKKFLESGLQNKKNKSNIDLVASNMRLKRSPLTVDRIINGYLDLQMNYPTLALNLLKYSMAKDNLQFTQTSFLKYINIAMFKQISLGLDKIMAEGHSTITDEHVQEFSELFLLYKPNVSLTKTFFVTDMAKKGTFLNKGDQFTAKDMDMATSLPFVFRTVIPVSEEESITRYYKRTGNLTWEQTEAFGIPSKGQLHMTVEQNIASHKVHLMGTLSGKTKSDPKQNSPGNPFESTEGLPVDPPKNLDNPFESSEGTPIKESRTAFLNKNSTVDDTISYNFTKAIQRLSKRFNIPVELVHQPDSTWRGRYQGGIVYLNTALLTSDTPFHEFAHPFIEAVRVKNVALYDNLVAEIIKEKKILQRVTQVYPDLDRAGRLDEAIVTAIGLYAAEEASVPKGIVQRIKEFLQEVANMIHSFWAPGSDPLISGINPNTSLRDLGALMAKGSERYHVSDITSQEAKDQRAVKLTVQPEHVEQVRTGEKVISLRDINDEIEFEVGDTLTVYANSKSQGIIVKLKSVDTMNKLTEKNQDKFAQALGYLDFADFKKKDQYANESSEMSRRFPGVYKFIQGEAPIQILFYEKVDEFEPGTETKIEKLVKDIKIALTKQIDRYDARISAKESVGERATLFVNKRKKLVQGLDAISDAEGVVQYIQTAKKDLRDAKNRLDVAITEAGNVKNLTEAKRHKLINDINYVQEFISAYSILTDDSLSEDKIKEMLGDGATAKEFKDAVSEYKNIVSKTDDVVVPALASWLIEFSDIDADAARAYFKQRIDRIKASNKNEKQKNKLIQKLLDKQDELVLTQEKLETQLREATRDIGFGSLWLEAAISSSDQVSSLFAKAVKNQEFKANLKDAIAQERIGQALQAYEDKTGVKNNADKFYKEFYNEITIAIGRTPDGNLITEKRLVLAKTHPTEEGQALLDVMTEVYTEALEQIPKGHRNKLIVKPNGSNEEFLSLPFVRKSSADRLQSSGFLDSIKTDFKEIYKPLATDTEYGFQTESGEVIKSIPIFYTQRGIGDRATDNKDISKDLVSSILTFTQMSNKFDMYKQIQTEVELFERTIDKRRVAKISTSGNRIQDKVAKTFGLTSYLNADTNRVNERVQAFINMQFYGMQEEPTIFTFNFRGEEYEVDTNKLLNFLGRWTGFTTLALNFLSALNNVILGNFYIFQEATARQNFGDLKFNLSKGKQLYYKGTPKMFSDVGKITGLSKETQLVRLYDAIQGDFREVSGGFVTGNAVKKRWTASNLFFLNHAGEHEMQVSTLFAALAGKKVKVNGVESSLWDAYELNEKGILELKKGTTVEVNGKDVAFDQKQVFKLMNQLHATNKALHGNYNDFDKSITQRSAIGRLALMFRKFMYPGYRRRFGSLIADNELDEMHEGYFAASFRLARNEMQELSQWLMFKENSLTEHEKAAVKKTIAEVGMWVTTMAMFALAAGAMGDDDDNWAGSLALYQIRRFQTELSFYFNPAEALKIIKSPAAATTTIQRVIKFMDQLAHTAAFDDEYTTYQTSGHGFKKGDSKLWVATKDLLPAIQGIERSLHPEAAIKYFDKLF